MSLEKVHAINFMVTVPKKIPSATNVPPGHQPHLLQIEYDAKKIAIMISATLLMLYLQAILGTST